MSSLSSYLAKKAGLDSTLLQKALLNQAIHGGGIGLNLLEVGAIDDETLVKVTGQFHRIPTVTAVECFQVGEDVASRLTPEICSELMLMPLRLDGSTLIVGCVDPPASMRIRPLEKNTGLRIKLVLGSPVVLPLAMALHGRMELEPRIARVARNLGEEAPGWTGLDDATSQRLAGLIEQAIERQQDEEISDEDWDEWDEWEDEDEPEDGDDVQEEEPEGERESVVGKYIIINRIGARRRRPSLNMNRPDLISRPPDRPAIGVKPSKGDLSEDDTRTSGRVKASSDTRPHRPATQRSDEKRPSRPPQHDSVPPAVLSEVATEYLMGGATSTPEVGAPPPPLSEPFDPAVEEAQPETEAEVSISRTVQAGPATEPEPETIESTAGREDRPGTTTLAGAAAVRIEEPQVPDGDGTGAEPGEPFAAAPDEEPEIPVAEPPAPDPEPEPGPVLERVAGASGAPVQGYAVEVPELVSLPEVLEALEKAERANDITDIVHRFALQFFDFVVVLRYRRGRFELSAASTRGWAWPVEELPGIKIGYDQLPETIRKLGQPHLGDIDSVEQMEEVVRAVGRPDPANCILMPIAVKGRAIVVIYGDNGNRTISFDEVHDLFHATWVATGRLLALLESKKK